MYAVRTYFYYEVDTAGRRGKYTKDLSINHTFSQGYGQMHSIK
jgi:hypothetical protein